MTRFILAAAFCGLGTTAAMAGETQPYQHGVTLFAYEKQVDNYCPAGTQPLRYNGVICCGTPNASGYGEAPVVRKKRYSAAKSYAPIPMGKSPGSYDGT